MIFDGDREQITPYFRQLADLMGLKDWTFALDKEPPESKTAFAAIHCWYGQRHAQVRVSESWATLTPEMFRKTMTHEAIHCHTTTLEMPMANIRNHIGEMLYQAVSGTYDDALEYAVDAMAVAWSVWLPLPVTAKTRKKVKA